ncbi:Degenerin-like protein unc-105 [Mizuhopecten yessoensis]|uniref:Degenerin-like protein unc-105 n=1 Tax=Mizuhopecten yessoensis TaxID=6573 RepID=A0A210PIM4_MIZYE|nr:Degenerin-like protein unc-105 [Mizuhopecten yessoensis]
MAIVTRSNPNRMWRQGADQIMFYPRCCLKGFQMTLNLETHEAIPHMTHGYGARIVLHQSGSFPLPAEEGMTLSPGYETSLGVRMAKISRLGPPHGSCAIPLGFFGKRGYNNISSSIRYSSQACLLDCKEMAIETICGCFESNIRNELYTGYSDRTDALRNCAESTNDFRCATAVTQDFLIGTRTCYCPNACNETIYSRVFSGRLWPSQDYLNELMESACSKYDLDYRSCPLHTLTHAEKSMNFLKINVYYEDLNYQYLSEEPEYELMNLLSDIGGSLGLFLGASALSIGEVFELLVELSCYFVQKRRNLKGGDEVIGWGSGSYHGSRGDDNLACKTSCWLNSVTRTRHHSRTHADGDYFRNDEQRYIVTHIYRKRYVIVV